MRRLLGIRPEDQRDAFLGFAVLAIVMAGHAMMEVARDTLFFTSVPFDRLPWAYLAIAALAAGAVPLSQAMSRRFDKRRMLTISLVASAAVTFVFYEAVSRGNVLTLYALYVWSGLVATVVVVQFWLLLGDIVTVTQAKRIFSFVASGGLVGATLGSVAAERIVEWTGPRELVLGGAVAFLLGAALPLTWPKETRPLTKSSSRRDAGRLAVWRGQPYARRLLALVLVSTVALTGADYVFKSIVAQEVPKEDFGNFFAIVNIAASGAGFVFQVAVAGWLLRALGVSRASLTLPSALLAALGTLFLFASTPLIPALIVKGADGSLRHSLHRTSSEVLFLPLPGALRDRLKGLIAAFGQRGGQSIASLAILFATAFGASTLHVALGVAVAVFGWLFIAIRIKPHYLDLFRANLRDGTIETKVDLADLDLHSLEVLVAALSSDDDDEVMAALELFADHNKAHLIPALILYHPSRDVVMRALEIFAAHERTDFNPVARRLMRLDDEEIRAGALRAISASFESERLLIQHLEDESDLVRTTALVALHSRGYGDKQSLFQRVQACASDPNPDVRRALAVAVRHQRDSALIPLVAELASDARLDVRVEVARALESIPSERFLPQLLDLLAFAATRGHARRAMCQLGKVGLYFLDEALYDVSLPRSIRRHIPRSIHRFDPEEASEVLLRHLVEENDEAVRFKILRGLGRLAADHPRLLFDTERLDAVFDRCLKDATRILEWRLTAEEARASRVDVQTSRRRHAPRASERTRAQCANFSLSYPWAEVPARRFPADLPRVPEAEIGSQKRPSRELLENSITGNYRSAVLALLSEAPAPERLASVHAAMGTTPSKKTYQEELVSMLSDANEAMQSIAAYHIAELGLGNLSGRLEKARPERPSYLGDVIDRALSMLQSEPVPEGPHAA